MDYRELTKNEINDLADKHWWKPIYEFPNHFEHRLDKICSRILYCLLRKYQPKVCLEFGTSWGGTSCVIISALQKNGEDFKFIGFEKLEELRLATEKHIEEKCKQKIEIYGDITENMDKIPQELDFVFIDPDWDITEDENKQPLVDIAKWTFENIIPRVKKDGLVCIHDWSVNRELEYQGGGFPGIFYFIELFKQGKMPLEKLFSVWDDPEYKVSSIALSFWRKV